MLTAVSNAVVQLHREHFGRGPGAARSLMLDDLVVCVLSDVFTPVERTLIGAGNSERVRESRLAHQLALVGEYKRTVAGVIGREVKAVVSGVHFDPDLATELFMLGPRPPDERRALPRR